ncbi:type IV toxin-antitoxin system AbiEi family antitoxin domain-containing protein [Thioalkalivibrio sp. HK1]|uniref:type IV toxin-antitoxin system AbiEi family antitoxin domain-containing protein n=1 Tax=Thioalkalivibrio sp. HK1 TaxID=1469245 RepID=UPI001E358B7E|nr:type IV toxin-antitoxin system AbiEi family antitoxin domain-containing protein [Thioalkalivibrio sp. HK1]
MSSMSEVSLSAERSGSQRDLARNLLEKRGIMRLVELRKAGVTAATVSRMERDEEVLRLARGIYQLSDAGWEYHHGLAEAAKRVPKGIVCLVSALAFHGVTTQLPRWAWMAIGSDDWAPRDSEGLRIVRFTENRRREDIETHVIEEVSVRVFGLSRTIVDCFRYRNKIGPDIAVEGLRDALGQRKTSLAEVACQATKYGIWTVIRPYIETYLSDD